MSCPRAKLDHDPGVKLHNWKCLCEEQDSVHHVRVAQFTASRAAHTHTNPFPCVSFVIPLILNSKTKAIGWVWEKREEPHFLE